MEVKINKEIRNYTEALFFGLNLRQCICSFFAIGIAAGVFLLTRNTLGMEIASWVCILAAAPFATLGFVTYHGMTAEQLVWAWLKSELLMPKRLRFREKNLYWEAINRAKNT